MLFAVAFLIASAVPAAAYNEVYLGEVHAFATKYCPRGWAPADGSELKIDDHKPLFALLGFEYGGDGKTTFALPDLRTKQPAKLEGIDKGHRFKLLWCVNVSDGSWPSDH
jgi:microcystin-dependent protein